MLNLCKGYKIYEPERLNEEYEVTDNVSLIPDDFDIENFTKEAFFMFSGEKVLVDLRCDNSLMKTMVDRFREDVTTLVYGCDFFQDAD